MIRSQVQVEKEWKDVEKKPTFFTMRKKLHFPFFEVSWKNGYKKMFNAMTVTLYYLIMTLRKLSFSALPTLFVKWKYCSIWKCIKWMANKYVQLATLALATPNFSQKSAFSKVLHNSILKVHTKRILTNWFFFYLFRKRWRKCNSITCLGSKFSFWKKLWISFVNAVVPLCIPMFLRIIWRKTTRVKFSR